MNLSLIILDTTEYLDFILIHSAMSDKERRLATWRALIEAKKQGKVKAIGVSN